MTPILSNLMHRNIAANICDCYFEKCSIKDLFKSGNMNAADASCVRTALANEFAARGFDRVGYKVGFTSSSVQDMLGIDSPEFGILASCMNVSNQDEVRVKKYCQTMVEPEIAFVLEQDMDARKISLQTVLEASAYVCAAIEIVESRVGFDAGLNRVISDNVGAGRFVLGSKKVCPRTTDIASVNVRLQVNNKRYFAVAGDVLGDPARSVLWLARRLSSLGENYIRKGDVVLSGSPIKPITVSSGTRVYAKFDGLESLSLRFV